MISDKQLFNTVEYVSESSQSAHVEGVTFDTPRKR